MPSPKFRKNPPQSAAVLTAPGLSASIPNHSSPLLAYTDQLWAFSNVPLAGTQYVSVREFFPEPTVRVWRFCPLHCVKLRHATTQNGSTIPSRPWNAARSGRSLGLKKPTPIQFLIWTVIPASSTFGARRKCFSTATMLPIPASITVLPQ
ncbi:MAG: hypothetical protein K8T20_18850 [Planctomycetes bacterium]|nr:hypothetical protein [Planctomycetota bacterium]